MIFGNHQQLLCTFTVLLYFPLINSSNARKLNNKALGSSSFGWSHQEPGEPGRFDWSYSSGYSCSFSYSLDFSTSDKNSDFMEDENTQSTAKATFHQTAQSTSKGMLYTIQSTAQSTANVMVHQTDENTAQTTVKVMLSQTVPSTVQPTLFQTKNEADVEDENSPFYKSTAPPKAATSHGKGVIIAGGVVVLIAVFGGVIVFLKLRKTATSDNSVWNKMVDDFDNPDITEEFDFNQASRIEMTRI